MVIHAIFEVTMVSHQGYPTAETTDVKGAPSRIKVVKWILAFVICNFIVGMIAFNSPPPGKTAMTTGLFCLVAGGFAIAGFKNSGNARDVKLMYVLTGTMIGTIAVCFLNFQKHVLYLDNQNNFEVLIKVDGEQFGSVAPYGFITTAIRLGDHKIESYKIPGDSLLEAFDIEIDSRNKYMYNVLSSGNYITGKESYAQNAFLNAGDYPSNDSKEKISERWMLMNYDYVFSLPPAEISVKGNPFDSDQTVKRDYIIRADASEQYW